MIKHYIRAETNKILKITNHKIRREEEKTNKCEINQTHGLSMEIAPKISLYRNWGEKGNNKCKQREAARAMEADVERARGQHPQRSKPIGKEGKKRNMNKYGEGRSRPIQTPFLTKTIVFWSQIFNKNDRVSAKQCSILKFLYYI